MRAILASIGSMGDTLPFISWGAHLKERGHDVTLVVSGHFKETVEKQGMDFVPALTADEYYEFIRGQSVWTEREGLKAMGEIVVKMIPRVYQILADRYVPGETVVGAQGYAFGARIAQEKLGIPTATVHLQPMWFRSIYDPPTKPFWFPTLFVQWIDRLIDLIVDYRMSPPTNGFRQELGLPPASRLMKSWWNSPQLTIGFFPEWFNPRQADWPANVVLPGFPLREGGGLGAYDPGPLEDYLAAGDPPLVFSQSSITSDTSYFEVSAEVARRLGRRAVFLTSHPEQLPPNPPTHVQAFRFAPLDFLLPRSAAHIHHGGIGTIAHTLAAGVPQLTVPMVYDQPDNSLRLQKLGVSRFMKRKSYKVGKVVKELARLLDSPDVAERCRHFAKLSQQTHGLENASIALEGLLGTDQAAAVAPTQAVFS